MPIGFPSSPTTGQQWPTVNPRWEWDGAKWVALPPGTPVTTIKPTPVGADRFILLDSAASYAPVLATLASLPGGGGAGALVTVTHNGGGANPVTGDILTAAFASGYTGSVQWQRNGTNIAGATNPTYMAVSADEGTTVRPQVTSLIYTATGLPVGAASPTVPGAFINTTNWNAAATATAGEMQYQINSLPSDGGSAGIRIEYTTDGGATFYTLSGGFTTGNRTVTAGWSAGVADDTQIRAVNAIGNGPWSTPPLNRTPASAASIEYLGETVSTGTNTVNVTLPAGLTATDTVFALACPLDSGTPNTAIASMTVSGWTVEATAANTDMNARLFSAPGNVSNLTFSATGLASVIVVAVRGSLSVAPAIAARYWGSGAEDHTSPAVTAGAGNMIVSVFVQTDGADPALGTPQADYTRELLRTSGVPWVSVLSRSGVTAGSTGTIAHGGGANFSSRVVLTMAFEA